MKFLDWLGIGLLKKLDQRWIRKYPLLWASRLHYLIFIEIIILLINLLVIRFVPINYANIPNALILFLYGAGFQFIFFLGWLYFQRMIDLRYFHTTGIRFFEIKTTFVFFLVTIIIGASSFIPGKYLTHRIIDILEDGQFQSIKDVQTYYAPETYLAEPVDSTSIDTTVTYFNALSRDVRKYIVLDRKDKFNAFIALNGDVLVSDFYKVSWPDSSDKTKWVSIQTYLRNDLGDLKLYYDTINLDTTYSAKFDRTVYHRRLRAEFKKEKENSRDTTIDRYYFSSWRSREKDENSSRERVDREFKDLRVASENSIQSKLIIDKIEEELPKMYPSMYQDGIDKVVTSSLKNLELTIEPWLTVNEWAALLLWICCIIPVIFIMTNSVVRLFNYRILFLGLIAPIVAAGVIVGFVFLFGGDFDGAAITVMVFVFIGVVGLFVGFFKRTIFSVLLLQFAISLMLVACLSIPMFYAVAHLFDNDDTSGLVWLQLGALAVLFASCCFYLRRLYLIYARPYR